MTTKSDFEMAEEAIDVAVNEADIHDDEDCPQDDTCECPTAATVNEGHKALVRIHDENTSLREQVRTLTAQLATMKQAHADAVSNGMTVADALRARVSNLMEDKESWDEREAALKAEADHLRGVVVARTEERDAERQEAELKQLALNEAWRDAKELRDRVAELEATVNGMRLNHGDVVTRLNSTIAVLRLKTGEAEDFAKKWHEAVAAAGAARDAALEEAGQRLETASAAMRHDATLTGMGPLRELRLTVADDRLSQAAMVRALKTQPTRRFVEATHITDTLAQVALDVGGGRVAGDRTSILLEIARRLGFALHEATS